jgi:hypothetical protein
MSLSHAGRVLVIAGAVASGCAIAVPAVIGLTDNPSFNQRIPVRVPSSARIVTFDDRGAAAEVAHRHKPRATPASVTVPRNHDDPSASPRTSGPAHEPGDDRGTHVEVGDDHGGHGGHGHGGHGDGGHGDGGHGDGGHGDDH